MVATRIPYLKPSVLVISARDALVRWMDNNAHDTRARRVYEPIIHHLDDVIRCYKETENKLSVEELIERYGTFHRKAGVWYVEKDHNVLMYNQESFVIAPFPSISKDGRKDTGVRQLEIHFMIAFTKTRYGDPTKYTHGNCTRGRFSVLVPVEHGFSTLVSTTCRTFERALEGIDLAAEVLYNRVASAPQITTEHYSVSQAQKDSHPTVL